MVESALLIEDLIEHKQQGINIPDKCLHMTSRDDQTQTFELESSALSAQPNKNTKYMTLSFVSPLDMSLAVINNGRTLTLKQNEKLL